MKRIERLWYSQASWGAACLQALSWIFGLLVKRRRRAYERGKRPVYRAPLPVIVVGNITVGGSGKTPLLIYLALALKKRGYHPGIVSRGYGASPPHFPWRVEPGNSVRQAGDEPLMIEQNTLCPLAIDPDRPEAVKLLLEEGACDLILSDDGLQHYAMARDIEIAVIDGERGLGNRLLLPAGPLREPPSRLDEVDFIVCQGEAHGKGIPDRAFRMELKATALQNLSRSEQLPPTPSSLASPVHAVAGIGNPQRFFNSLIRLGFDIIPHSFKDHHAYRPADLDFGDGLDVVMTEKDAVKCRPFAGEKHWVMQVDTQVEGGLMEGLAARLLSLKSG